MAILIITLAIAYFRYFAMSSTLAGYWHVFKETLLPIIGFYIFIIAFVFLAALLLAAEFTDN